MALGLDRDTLIFEFPEVHRDAVLRVEFQRTLRVPDDGRRHRLPPGLGRFPLRAVDDLDPARLPAGWARRGGIAMPMWQAEACWLNFSSPTGYPFLLKVAAGKVNAVNGKPWDNAPDFADQDYLEVPGQPWLDGFCVEKGVVRQFVAMPLGQGYTAEEQVTGSAEHGGVQLLAHPLKAALWEKRLEEARNAPVHAYMAMCVDGLATPMMPSAMGLAPGGSILQEIKEASEPPEAWETTARSRCFVHLANSLAWQAIAGEAPPTVPPTAADYARAGLPWFEWYADGPAKAGSPILAGLKSVAALGREKGQAPLPENEGFEPPEPIRLGPSARVPMDGWW
ncbi:hypothetical protein J5Y09_02170 [Roseomonas sp. PWR1]|uniref:Integral membrane protein n=1 Tax=Roseomonas nitratireducens TaxID=2820810 RepID=A0ABS4AMX2_9PROT|nr:hypothetical protein [Neoroseomonas nitratireducens]MBP0462705.1 hypothetical protein [Neoroseomonas nitratireducens]